MAPQDSGKGEVFLLIKKQEKLSYLGNRGPRDQIALRPIPRTIYCLVKLIIQMGRMSLAMSKLESHCRREAEM